MAMGSRMVKQDGLWLSAGDDPATRRLKPVNTVKSSERLAASKPQPNKTITTPSRKTRSNQVVRSFECVHPFLDGKKTRKRQDHEYDPKADRRFRASV